MLLLCLQSHQASLADEQGHLQDMNKVLALFVHGVPEHPWQHMPRF